MSYLILTDVFLKKYFIPASVYNRETSIHFLHQNLVTRSGLELIKSYVNIGPWNQNLESSINLWKFWWFIYKCWTNSLSLMSDKLQICSEGCSEPLQWGHTPSIFPNSVRFSKGEVWLDCTWETSSMNSISYDVHNLSFPELLKNREPQTWQIESKTPFSAKIIEASSIWERR